MTLDKERYRARFLADFDQRVGEGEVPGSAGLSLFELRTYRALLRTRSSDEVRELIIGEGLPIDSGDIGPEDLGETAYKHLCVVAGYLFETRGVDASSATVESYITKNRFDRWLFLELVIAGRLSGDCTTRKMGDLDEDWTSVLAREDGYVNDQVRYPVEVDNTKIYGVAKPHRYWPAQLMRYIEFLRLGKMSTAEMQALAVGDTTLVDYAIRWDEFSDVLVEEESLSDIAIGIAVRTMGILKERGLTDEQVVKLVVAGYSPGGPMNEHGNIHQVHDIWSGILNRVEENNALAHLREGLRRGVEERMQAVNVDYKLRYDTNR